MSHRIGVLFTHSTETKAIWPHSVPRWRDIPEIHVRIDRMRVCADRPILDRSKCGRTPASFHSD